MIRVLLADDHPALRAGIRATLAETGDLQIVGEAGDGTGVERLAGEADVVVLDLSMPGPGFRALIERLRSRFPAVQVLVLSMHAEVHYVVAALRAGAAGYVTKDRSLDDLVDAIRTVAAGRRYVTRGLAEQLADVVSGDVAGPVELSDREREVLRLIAGGMSGKEIAAHLDISPKTVSTYRARLLDKLQLRTTADLIRYALEQDPEAT